jgi:ribosomal protein S18 acetylase RimI-like enzyme
MAATFADRELYRRGAATVIGSWEAIARGAAGAEVIRVPGGAAAVFPSGPERTIYNNAFLERDLAPPERVAALDLVEAAYRAASVTRYAVWLHESDDAMRSDVEARGYALDTATRAMAMPLDAIDVPEPRLVLAGADWSDYVRHLETVGVPPGLLAGVDPSPFQLLLAAVDGETAASALAFDLHGDCGVYNVSTMESHRRRGLGSALTARLTYDACMRGCETASLQATPMAERLYASMGFRDLGRILEYVPS